MRLNPKYILYIGRIEVNQKGLDLLLKSWSRIANKTRFKLAIAGTGLKHEVNILKKLIVDLNLEKSVVMLGDIRGEEKSIVFDESLFVVLPSRFETFSVVALEALSRHLPLISFDIDGLDWIPVDFCTKIKKFDTQALSQTMLELTSKSVDKLQLNGSVEKFIKQFTWDNIYKKYEKYLNDLILN